APFFDIGNEVDERARVGPAAAALVHRDRRRLGPPRPAAGTGRGRGGGGAADPGRHRLGAGVGGAGAAVLVAPAGAGGPAPAATGTERLTSGLLHLRHLPVPGHA